MRAVASMPSSQSVNYRRDNALVLIAELAILAGMWISPQNAIREDCIRNNAARPRQGSALVDQVIHCQLRATSRSGIWMAAGTTRSPRLPASSPGCPAALATWMPETPYAPDGQNRRLQRGLVHRIGDNRRGLAVARPRGRCPYGIDQYRGCYADPQCPEPVALAMITG